MCFCLCVQFIQWNIHRCGVKQSEQLLPQEATGPFILSGYSGYKQVSTSKPGIEHIHTGCAKEILGDSGMILGKFEAVLRTI